MEIPDVTELALAKLREFNDRDGWREVQLKPIYFEFTPKAFADKNIGNFDMWIVFIENVGSTLEPGYQMILVNDESGEAFLYTRSGKIFGSPSDLE